VVTFGVGAKAASPTATWHGGQLNRGWDREERRHLSRLARRGERRQVRQRARRRRQPLSSHL